ncbi:MAG: hypothetical protein K0V04_11635 [Deltaproteobacteria bacterium]|nr:hypothetical protein [Deltaproteobacteria bacterium]
MDNESWRNAGRVVALSGLAFGVIACSTVERDDRGFGGPGLGPGLGPDDTGQASDSGEQTDDGGPGDDGGPNLDVGSADDGGSQPEECAEFVEEADVGNQPADIIIVIDNSQSMGNEIAAVQVNMNAFSAQIAGADVDPHVIMISGFEHNSDSGICVPPPLGSGLCPVADHNPPGYWRVDNWVGSHSALARVVQHFPDYQAGLRPTAATHVVVITDDDSDWSAQQFIDQFTALDPNFADFTLHAIINGSGSVYAQLANQTGGVVGNLDANQFQPIFDTLATTVITTASLACEYPIPALGPGEVFDPDKVNVEFSDGAGNLLEIGRVDSPAACASVADGWYYDDPGDPQMILLCGQTCDAIQGYEQASVGVIFGCDTIPAG